MLPTMMSPSRFHDPPTATDERSHKVCGGPPDTSSFFSLPPLSNARKRLSGGQKGGGAGNAASDPERNRTSSESIARIQSRGIPSEPAPKNARWRPSGDTL